MVPFHNGPLYMLFYVVYDKPQLAMITMTSWMFPLMILIEIQLSLVRLRCVMHWSVKGNLENSVSNHTIDITLKLTLKCYFENSKCHSSSDSCELWTYHRCSWNPDFTLLVATVISLFSLFYIKVLIDSS